MRIRKSISPWTVAIFILSLAALAVIVITLNKPLPTYLVAKRALVPGEQLTAQDVDFLNLDLGPLESNYLREIPADLAVRSAVPAGELIPVSRLGTQLSENQPAGEGLFSEEIPEVELLVGREQAMLVITALAADFDVFVLPVK